MVSIFNAIEGAPYLPFGHLSLLRCFGTLANTQLRFVGDLKQASIPLPSCFALKEGKDSHSSCYTNFLPKTIIFSLLPIFIISNFNFTTIRNLAPP